MIDSALAPAIAALEQGTNRDPFAVLGPHPAKVGGRSGLVVRVFLPDATSVMLITPSGPGDAVMERVDAAGLFEAFLPGWEGGDPLAFDYRLRTTWHHGQVTEAIDPYRFGRILSDFDLYLFAEGTQLRGQEKLGAHLRQLGSIAGVHFAVWAPNAQRVSVVGDFNTWDGRVNPMRLLMPHGVWEIFVPGLGNGEKYKFEIRTSAGRSGPQDRPVRAAPRDAAALRVHRLGRGAVPVERPGVDASAGRLTTPGWTVRCRCTRCTSGRGRAARTGSASCRTASWPSGWCLTYATRASPTSSCCRSWSTPSPGRGATRSWASSPPPAAWARRRISSSSWTPATARGLA